MNLTISAAVSTENNFSFFEHFEGSTDVLINEIFSRIDFRTFENLGCVNKQLNRLTHRSDVLKSMIYKFKTFNQEDWLENFDLEFPKNQAFKALPDNIGKLFNGPCPLFKDKRLRDTHVIIWIPTALSLNKCKLLLEKIIAANGHRFIIHKDILATYGDLLTDDSKWIIMPKNLLPESNHNNFLKQLKMVDSLALYNSKKYYIPTFFEATVCISMSSLKWNMNILEDCYTRCQEDINEFQILVGRLKTLDLSLSYDRINYNGDPWVNIGIAPILELKDLT